MAKVFRHAMLAGLIHEVMQEVSKVSVTGEKLKGQTEILDLLTRAKMVLDTGATKTPLETSWQFVRTAKLIADQVHLSVDGLDAIDSSPQLFGK